MKHRREKIEGAYRWSLNKLNQSVYLGKIVALEVCLYMNLKYVYIWLVGVTLNLRSERPDLGLGFDLNWPIKCPYYARIYIFKPSQSCPSCGAWLGRIN